MIGVLENISHGIAVVSAEGQVVAVNQLLEEMLGLSGQAVEGMETGDFHRSFLIPRLGPATGDYDEVVEMCRRGTPPADADLQILSSDAADEEEARWVRYERSRVTSGSYAGGHVECYVDITANKKNEKRLHELNQFWESAIEAANVWVDVLDSDANVMIWNKAAERMSGYSRDEVIGHAEIWKWLYPDERYRRHILEKAKSIIDRGDPVEDLETVITCKNGKQRTISWHSQGVVDKQGERMGSVAIGRDVTEHRALERHLRRVHKAEAIGSLASGVAHDFNNIVSVIKGYAQLASRKCAPDDTLKKYVAMICKLCGRAEHVVEQIFSFARREEQPLRPVRLQRFIDEAAGLLRSTSPSNIRIRLEVDSMCSPIKGDSTRLQQLLLNLCTNAMHAMEEKGGQLLLRLSQISLTDLEKTHPSHASSLEPGDYVVLGVEDSGTGIEPKLIDRIFEPYFTTKEKGKGTGLGLAVAQSIVQSHRGAVFVDSSPGKGTEFSIYFPVAAGDETSVEPAAGDQPQI